MRILVCATEYYPEGSGIANVAYNVVRQLEKRGVKFTICSPTGPDIKLGNPSLIKKFGIFGLIYYWYQVSKHFKQPDYDIAWLHNPLFIKRNPFPNSFATIHITTSGQANQNLYSFPFSTYKKISSFIEKYCIGQLKNNGKFTAINPQVILELQELGICQESIHYIPNGVDITRFYPSDDKKKRRKKFGIKENDIVLLNVGRFTPQKQHKKMIKVFADLEGKIDNISLYISGRGELFAEMQKYSKKLRINNVFFLGYVEDYDLPSLYSCADYFLITSNYEGLPLTLLEAMASGLPCIVSDIPNFQIVKTANCGIILDFNNIDDAVYKIFNYINNNNSTHSINARRYAVEQFDWTIISEKYYKIFRKSM